MVVLLTMKKSRMLLILFCTIFFIFDFVLADTKSNDAKGKTCSLNPLSKNFKLFCKKDGPSENIDPQRTGVKKNDTLSNKNQSVSLDKKCSTNPFSKNFKLICKKDEPSKKIDPQTVSIKKNDTLIDKNQNVSLYTGTFDIIDKEGDDKTTLVGIEHKNENLFRNTWLGKFSPTTGAFVTGKSSLYLYSGVATQYSLGPLDISPSFAPGYYQKGDGKDLGSVLEFKSEIKVGLDILENSKIGYSYSHISNNDWGEKNPGTDNQQITFSKNF